MSRHWTTEQIPDQTGRVAIVTGANSGIGFETAMALAEKGADVILACRSLEKARAAESQIRYEVSNSRLEIIRLDLANLASVQAFAETFLSNYDRLDLLINNAGVMIPPFTKTVDGFELQFGANHLGHFALTALLLEQLLSTPQARVVNVSSTAHRMGSGTINFENLNAEQGYSAQGSYSQSKLANLLFMRELNRRIALSGADVMALGAHPGWTVTGLQKGFLHGISWVMGQRPAMGALPTLRAAIDPEAQPNDYYGPSGMMEMRGHPVKVQTSEAARDPQLAQHLWEVSEEMTGIGYEWPTPVTN